MPMIKTRFELLRVVCFGRNSGRIKFIKDNRFNRVHLTLSFVSDLSFEIWDLFEIWNLKFGIYAT